MKDHLAQLVAGQTLTLDEATDAFEQIMTGRAAPEQTAALLAIVQQRGATIDELIGAARVMRRKVSPVDVPTGLRIMDTCGTGGSGLSTINVSTASAIVVAAAGREEGLAVAKHGNRSVTRKSGSSQVLEALGVRIAAPPATLTRCLAEAGIAFCFAPAHHPAMKHAGPVRAALGFATIFNLVGPLTNPAGAQRQLMGVYSPRLLDTLAAVLVGLEARHAWVVNGSVPREAGAVASVDELSICGPSQVREVIDGRITSHQVDPATLDLPLALPSSIQADSPEHSAALIREVLAGREGPCRDVVLLNAGAALVVGGVARNLAAGMNLAADAIDDGRAADTLHTLARVSAEDA